MCNILMSINPEYVEGILNGRKKYEYRKVKAKRNKIEKIYIYSTAPVMKVVGEVEVKKIIEDNPKKLWDMTSDYSGISKKFYDEYFNKRDVAIAYELGKVYKYDVPKDLKELGIDFVPQSFIYLD